MIEIDASDYVFESIFSQYNEERVLYSVTYFSKKHNPVKCNYKIYDKELIIIIHVFKK